MTPQQPEWEGELLEMSFCDVGSDGNIYQRTDKLKDLISSLLAKERERLVEKLEEMKKLDSLGRLPIRGVWEGYYNQAICDAQEVIKKQND